MNWNGQTRNGVLGGITACREAISTVKQRGSLEGAEWLLDPVNPGATSLISLIAPLTNWATALPELETEKWLMWAMQEYPIEVRQWLGYTSDWTMMPAAVCKRFKEIVRIARRGRLPRLYLLPATPRQSDIEKEGPITLDNSWVVNGVKLATVTYMLREGEWYKVYYPKLPSNSAVNRAIRLYLLGILLGRKVTSANELVCYEVVGLKNWLLYGDLVNGIAQHETLFHLLTEPEIGGQLEQD